MNFHSLKTSSFYKLFSVVALCTVVASTSFFTQQVQAATFVVTTNADSGLGSLRDAMTQAIATVGADTISFNLPSGQLKISPLSPLPTITDNLTIDGTTQTGFTSSPLVEIDGTNAGNVNGITFNNVSAGAVKSLVINNFSQGSGIYVTNNANAVSIEGTYLGTNKTGTAAAPNSVGITIDGNTTNTTVGGVGANQRNLISGNLTNGINGYNAINLTVANTYIGTNLAGNAALANGQNGINLAGTSFTTSLSAKIGLPIVGGGNLISGNNFNGINATLTFAAEIMNNIIGLNAGATAAIPNGSSSNYAGINLRQTIQNFNIGSSSANSQNIISGNTGDGILIYGNNVNNGRISNNLIGTNTAGATGLGNGKNGVEIFGSNDIVVGGIGAGFGNTIAYNDLHGIAMDAGSGVSIPFSITVLGNSIKNNTKLGINLANPAENANFIDPNDTLDPDSGPNNLQNSPVITTRTINVTDITISGTLNSWASSIYRVELFATTPIFNDTTDREGNEYLGYQQVTTDSSGNASWSINIPLSYQNHTYSVNATRFSEGTVGGNSFGIKPFNIINNDEYYETSEFNAKNFSVPLSATLSKTHNKPTGAAPGQSINYSVAATNTSSVPLASVVVTDILDPNLTYTPGSCAPNTGGTTCNFNSGTNTITWNIPTLNASTNIPLTFQATLNASTPTTITTVNNTATLTATGLTAQASSVGLGVNHPTPVVPSNNLNVVADKPQITQGENLTYDVTFTNNGSVVLTGVQVQTTLDPNLEFVSCSGGCSQSGQVLTWNVASMALTQNITNQVVARAKTGFTGNVTTVSNLSAVQLPTPKTQSIVTPVTSNPIQTISLPRTGGSKKMVLFPAIMVISMVLFLLSTALKSQKRKIVVKLED
jgi:uncharacterized repeat protein (TIGR01451 family)